MKALYEYKIHYPAVNYILLDFGNVIDKELNKYVLSLAAGICHDAILEIIPSYAGILIEYNDALASSREIVRSIKGAVPLSDDETGAIHEIPVVYGGKSGPDLDYVAKNADLTVEQVIDIHTSGEYRVFMLGFLPGFCYLGGLDSRIACKRLDTPRLSIPAGSVGIAGNQTGIYPEESPGGWRIIGRTDFKMYCPDKKVAFPVKAGDTIKFKAVSNV